MKINLTQKLKSVTGQTIVLDDGKTPATLRDIAVIALRKHAHPSMPPEERDRRGKLARRMATVKELEVIAEDAARIKDSIGWTWPPEVVTPAWEAIEGTAK